MEASLCGVTCICSPVHAYTDVISHGETGLIAETAKEWHQAITSLINDPSEIDTSSDRRLDYMPTIYLIAKLGENSGGIEYRNQFTSTTTDRPCKKVLVMNVFFAHQSIGGATRVAQDYVQAMLTDEQTNYEVTVLCTEYNNWQSDPPNLEKLKEIEQEPFLSDLQNINYIDYKNQSASRYFQLARSQNYSPFFATKIMV